MSDTFMAQIDGQTFLSQEEVDAYYDQQVTQEYEERGES